MKEQENDDDPIKQLAEKLAETFGNKLGMSKEMISIAGRKAEYAVKAVEMSKAVSHCLCKVMTEQGWERQAIKTAATFGHLLELAFDHAFTGKTPDDLEEAIRDIMAKYKDCQCSACTGNEEATEEHTITE